MPGALLLSFGVVFVAELGDKSQLMALAFATRYRALPILFGITVATGLVHAISVAIGLALERTVPTGWITLAAAAAFLGFAVWTLRGDTLSRKETGKEGERARQASGSGVLVTGIAFFLAELGDKTMLATVALATQVGPWGAWLGSTLGMVTADALAIVLGSALGVRLPERVVRLGAALCFAVFGVALGVQAVTRLSGPLFTTG